MGETSVRPEGTGTQNSNQSRVRQQLAHSRQVDPEALTDRPRSTLTALGAIPELRIRTVAPSRAPARKGPAHSPTRPADTVWRARAVDLRIRATRLPTFPRRIGW